MIKAGITGALGKMGKEVVKAVLNSKDIELTAAIDIIGNGLDIGEAAIGKPCGILVESY